MKKSLLAVLAGMLVSQSTLAADDLATIYQLAVKNDPQLLRAAANVDIGKEAVEQAFSSFLPQIAFGAGYDINKRDVDSIGNDTTGYSYGFTLSQSIYDQSNWETRSIAEKSAMQDEISYALAQQALILRVSFAYFDVLKASDDLDFVRAEKRAIERQLEQTKQRFAVGLTAITDVHEAQAQFDNAIAQEIRAENNVEISKEFLREITNQFHAELASLNTDRFSAQRLAENAAQWVEKAENMNLELKIQRLNVDIAKLNIDNAKTGHYPTIGLTASLGGSSVTDADIVANEVDVDNATLGINLSVPIYTGGFVSSNVRSAQAAFVATSEGLEETHRKVVREIRSAYADVSSIVPAIKALEQAVVSAESALKATEAGFEVGTRNIVEVLNSTRNLFNARRNLSSIRYDYILAVLSLKQSAGTLTGEDLAMINKGLN